MKNKFDSFKDYLSQLATKFKSFDKEKLQIIIENTKAKLKNIKKEDIVLWWYKNRDKVLFYTFSILSTIIFVSIIVYSVKTYLIFDKLNKEVVKVEIITDKKLISLVKKEKLRTIGTFSKTFSIVNYGKVQTNPKYYAIIYYILFNGLLNDSNYKLLALNYLQKKHLTQSDLMKLAQNDKELQNLLNNYINTFPSISDKAFVGLKVNSKFKEKFKLVLKNLYIYEILFIYNNLKKKASNIESQWKLYSAPYQYFLKSILLPSVDIWTNLWSGKINPDIFGAQYLSKASYIDINLINYWSNFFEYSFKSKYYQGNRNIINNISLTQLKILDKKYAQIGLKFKFGLLDDISFYALLSKLTLTSNVKNLMLLSEFTFDLWINIRQRLNQEVLAINNKKLSLGEKLVFFDIQQCQKDNSCGKLFGLKGNDLKKLLSLLKQQSENIKLYKLVTLYNVLVQNFPQIENSSFGRYMKNEYYKINDLDVLLGARLHDCLLEDGYCDDLFDKNYSQIVKAIQNFAACDTTKSYITDVCSLKFINKFDTNYFIPYTLVDHLNNDPTYNLLDRLKDVYKNLYNISQLGQFTFTKLAKNALSAEPIKYSANVSLSVYYKYLDNNEYNSIMAYIGQHSCKSVTNGSSWNLNLAYAYISKQYTDLSQSNTVGADELYNLMKIKDIISNLQKETKNATLLDKLLANLQVYRILKEQGYCTQQ